MRLSIAEKIKRLKEKHANIERRIGELMSQRVDVEERLAEINKKGDEIAKLTCPGCGKGVHGRDALCNQHYSEYLGTHLGSRDELDDTSW